MYNYTRRCLIALLTNHRKFLTRSSQDAAVVSKSDYYCSHNLRDSTICKRFYCQAATKINTLSSVKSKNDDVQRQLDEFLSDPENKKYYQILELEVDVLRHSAEKVPDEIGPQEWLNLLGMTSKLHRKKYLKYLWTNEKSNLNKKAQKKQKTAEWLAKKVESPEEETGEMKYGLSQNSLFLRIYQTSMNHFLNHRLMQAIMFEPKIVFDCGYENNMNMFDIQNCAKQLTIVFATNRSHISPMCLYFCNANKEGTLMQSFHRNLPILYNDDFPAYVTSQSYLDLFPKERLVYLTPHCKTDLDKYDPEAVYIVGAIVDKSNPKPVSLAKAKKEGIRMAKLPIEKYLKWGSGSTKNLTLNQIMAILLDIKHTRDWNEAFRHIPARKLQQAREYMLNRKIEKNALKNPEIGAPILRLDHLPTDFTFASRKNKQ